MSFIASDGTVQDKIMASGEPITGTDAKSYRASDGSLQGSFPVEGGGGGGGEGGPVEWDDVLSKPSTFPPIIGTTATTAKAGDYSPAWGEVTAKPAFMAVGASAEEARDAISAIGTDRIGVPGGIAPLDQSGMLPVDRINVSGLTFKGAWNAATNSPALLDGTGSVGDFYKVSEPGTFNFGNGAYDFVEGDWVIFAAGVWQRIGVHEAVASVNGQTGMVVLTAADVGALPADYEPPAYVPPPFAAIHVQEQASAGTNGGATTAGTWAARALSAVKENSIPGATFAARTINLPAGKYKVEATGCTYFAGSNRMRITAGGVPILHGVSAWSSNNQINNFATLKGVFTLASPTAIQLQHRVSYGHATGWGMAANYDGQPEVFSELLIEKVG